MAPRKLLDSEWRVDVISRLIPRQVVRGALITILIATAFTSIAGAEDNPRRWFETHRSTVRLGLFADDPATRDATDASISRLALEAGFYLPLEHADRLARFEETDYFLHCASPGEHLIAQASYMALRNPAYEDYSLWLVNFEPYRHFALTGGKLSATLHTVDGESHRSEALTGDHALAETLSRMQDDFSAPERFPAFVTTTRKLIFPEPGLKADRVARMTISAGELEAECWNWVHAVNSDRR